MRVAKLAVSFPLQVLHYLNALVSLQIMLLKDEEREQQWIDNLSTTATKPFTCPVLYSRSAELQAEAMQQAMDGKAAAEVTGDANSNAPSAAPGRGAPLRHEPSVNGALETRCVCVCKGCGDCMVCGFDGSTNLVTSFHTQLQKAYT